MYTRQIESGKQYLNARRKIYEKHMEVTSQREHEKRIRNTRKTIGYMNMRHCRLEKPRESAR